MIADQPGETRRLLEFCGLEWDEAVAVTAGCGPGLTSRAALWRHHESHLAGLRAQLTAAGIEVEEAHI